MIEYPSQDKPSSGSIRFNTDSSKLEIYNGEAWWEIDATSPEQQTGGTRGVFSGGGVASPNPATNVMDFINIDTTGDAIDFGDLSAARQSLGATSDRTRGIVVGGYLAPANKDIIEFFTFASTGSRADFEDLTFARRYPTGSSNGTRGLISGGYTSDYVEEMEYVTIQEADEAVDFGNLITAATDRVAVCSPTKSVIAGGQDGSGRITSIEYVMTSTLGNGASFGDLTAARRGCGGSCNSIRGVWMGGDNPADTNTIDYIEFASLGNAFDFGDLSTSKGRSQGHVSSPTRGIAAGGFPNANNIQYIQLMSKGDSIDFGDLTRTSSDENAGASNGHGGLG